MLTLRHLELAEELFELEPAATYPARAAAAVARLAGASSHRIVLDGTDVVGAGGPEGKGEPFAVPLRHGKNELGVLHLWFGDLARPEEAHLLARWGGRVLSRGLAYARRLANGPGPRALDVEALLARTPLTPRERDVVARLIAGHSTREIARSTGLTVATVNTYLKRIFAKLGVHSRVELLARLTGMHAAPAAPRGRT